MSKKQIEKKDNKPQIAPDKHKTKKVIPTTRIGGGHIPLHSPVLVGLTAIYGVGLTISKVICEYLGIEKTKRVKDLTDAEKTGISHYVEKHCVVENELRKQERLNIEREKSIGSYRGLRHKLGLPVRGQRTKTNSKTRRRHKGVA